MRKILFTFIFMLSAMAAMAQNKVSVSGIITCVENGVKDGVVGAQVELMSLRDTLDKKYTLTAIRGAYQFKQVAAGKYRMIASSLGYKTDTMEITVERGKNLEVPEWEVEMERHKIDEVNVVTKAVRTSINGDTISYNAAAFKVLPDADADELLSKLPGLKVDGGTITTQGETVQKILVDGREFFGSDVSTAIKTIPADQIKSIEVFDKLSDEAEFSGIDDGNSYKAINLVTKIKTAIFGKFNAMYAFEPKTHDKTQHYGSTDGTVNFFRKVSKTTLRFSANNMNGNSDSKMGMGGINYIAQWGENDKVKLEGSYTFNANNNKHWSWSDRDYFLTDEEIANNPLSIYQRQVSNSNSQGKGNSHSFNTRFEWKISERQRLMIRANVSTSDNENNGTNVNNYFPIEGDDILLNSWNIGQSDNISTGVNGHYMVRIGEKAGRTFQVNFGGNYNTSGSDSENYSEKMLMLQKDSLMQRSGSDNYGYSLNGGVTYAEPIGQHAQVTVGYNVNYNESDADRLTRLYDFENEVYLPDFDPKYSNSHNTTYLTQRVGPGFRYGNEGTSVSGRLNYQHVTMNSERIYPALFTLPETTFENFTYSLMARIKLNMENRLMVRVNSRTSNPSVGQLQDVVDISNINHISAGNPNLQPSYSHNANLNYNYSGIENGITFSVGVNGAITQRSIETSVIRNSPGYQIMSPDNADKVLATLSSTGQFSKPVNVDGKWNYGGHIGMGFPITWIGCNFNIDANGGVSQSPSLIGRWDGTEDWMTNYSKRYNVGGGMSINSNFSDYVDFNVSYHPSYSNVTNTTSPESNRQELNHRLWGNVRVVFGFGLTLSANANYSKTQGLNKLASQLDHENLICNFGIGMKVFKKMGEFQLVANDVFNRNDGFNRSWNSQFMQTSMSSVIGRYFGLKFTYNLRRNTGAGQSSNQRGGFDPSMMGSMGGPGGGMGGPGGGPGGFGGGFGGGRGGF
ncbi:MAG: outer membrane beta-barrel protein [Alistipes sp.]|nr:outer membrane beta-barrel protein [Alistipes sp.]